MSQLTFFENREGLLFPENLLDYYPDFMENDQALRLLEVLINTTPWVQQPIRMYGKDLLTPRLTAWYGDSNKTYSYSGTKNDPIPWTEELTSLKNRIEGFTGHSFNSVLLNYYRDGNDSVAWHSDDERELGTDPVIASLSMGQVRQFDFRHKQDHSRKYSLQLTNGSLLLMKGDLQHHWEHRIPKSTKAMGPRINLTFRVIY